MKIISKGKPANQIKPVRKGSKKSLILSATLKGASIEDLMKVTGWARSAASDVSPSRMVVELPEMWQGYRSWMTPICRVAGGTQSDTHGLDLRGMWRRSKSWAWRVLS